MTKDVSARLLTDRDSEFLIHRDVYRDPEVFDWEMMYIFEGTWNLVGLSSQVPKPYDFFTTFVGRAPVIVTRDANGELHCPSTAAATRAPWCATSIAAAHAASCASITAGPTTPRARTS